MNASHSSTLIARHAGLDARITAERSRPAPDEALLSRLKKQKLKIKEMLVGL
ncbi:MAG: YdcH family protein [Sphingomonadaceae bacterium]|nr:YdcH family protein [Sphingomonadaceae bacterium]